MNVAFVTTDGIVRHPSVDAIVASIIVQRLLPLAQRRVPPGPRRDRVVADIPVAEGRTAAEMMQLGSKAFPPLPHVTSELAALQRLYESAVLVNQDFRIPNVEKELQEECCPVIHIASHGQCESDVEKTFCLLLTINSLWTVWIRRSGVFASVTSRSNS